MFTALNFKDQNFRLNNLTSSLYEYEKVRFINRYSGFYN